MALTFTTSYIEDSRTLFAYYKGLAERAIAQVNDEDLFRAQGPESNSIAIIVKHMAGNMRSRWTDFLNTDGEKPWRNRDTEFENPPDSRESLIQTWDAGWALVLSALDPLTDADLARVVTIRGENHSVMQAIARQTAHYAYHVGQIVMLAKDLRGADWTSLSVPRGRSGNFNQQVAAGEASQR